MRSSFSFRGLEDDIVARFGPQIGPWLARRVARSIGRLTGHSRAIVEVDIQEGPSDHIPGPWGRRAEGSIQHYQSGRTFTWKVATEPD